MRRFVYGFSLLLLLGFILGGWSFLPVKGKPLNTQELLMSKEFIRFHVVANSDSEFDQSLKIEIRDRLLEYLAPRLAAAASKEEAKTTIVNNQKQLIAIADAILAKAGAGYQAGMEVGIYEFPVRMYGALIVPAGQYETVRLQLGEAAGKNWWCVLFPPLCFVDINSSIAAQPVSAALKENSYREQTGTIVMRWKLAEFFSTNEKGQ